MLLTTEEVVAAIGNLDKLEQEYHQKYLAFYNKFCSWEDGQASRNVAKKVFGLKGDLNEADN